MRKQLSAKQIIWKYGLNTSINQSLAMNGQRSENDFQEADEALGFLALRELSQAIQNAEPVKGTALPCPKGAEEAIKYAYKSGIEDTKKGIFLALELIKEK